MFCTVIMIILRFYLNQRWFMKITIFLLKEILRTPLNQLKNKKKYSKEKTKIQIHLQLEDWLKINNNNQDLIHLHQILKMVQRVKSRSYARQVKGKRLQDNLQEVHFQIVVWQVLKQCYLKLKVLIVLKLQWTLTVLTLQS